ncbi:PLP-dependent aminotransferase family protein [Natronospirillum operosum]|uniref:PLP-dependent aminotransferase family protein n=1 Tax=Natronospirillum operosum TaxID=2759953 RepID=A0A4Z0WFA8_9GAMM|nr:PLP-dependent aminotransferase family protein [Natronospirillum operosum]TGG93228.1 PLP-dependent aminotransferase family protein [Natronospirillum operosum]
MTIWTPEQLPADLPKYQAIAAVIRQAIEQGTLSPGTRLPPQRRLADMLAVTTGTVTRAYAEAERLGLLEARVGSGTYVRQCSQVDSFRFSEQRSDIDLGFTLALRDQQLPLLQDNLQAISQDPVLLEELLGYGPETGLYRHRAAASRWLAREGTERSPENILLCSGGQNGLFTALTTLCDTGDTVLSEGLTYSGFILAARHLRLRHIGLNMDEQGLHPDALKTACERYRPRALYLMPQLQNPTGSQMSQARKTALLDICRHYGVMVIEDNVQSALVTDAGPPMVALAPEQVVGISSCTKALAGGLRVGFLLPPPSWMDRFRVAIRVNSWMVPPLLSELVARWIEHPRLDTSLRHQRAQSARRHDLARTLLRGFDYRAHPQSLSGWLMLPEHWRARDLTQHLHRQGIEVKAADVFAVGQFPAPEAIRLCIGGDTTEWQLETALTRLRDCLGQPQADDHWLADSTV